jgi:aconitate hydratase
VILHEATKYFVFSDRDEKKVHLMEEYLKSVQMFRNYSDATQDPVFSEIVTLDLATVVSSVSGPKRPHDRVPVVDMPTDFRQCLMNKV